MQHDPEANFGFLLADTSRLLRRNFDRRARQLGLNRAQWQVLAHLSRNEGIKQVDLADILEVQPITLARQIDRLEGAELVERQADDHDRRVRRLYITERARPMLESLFRLGRETRNEALEGLSTQERQQLLEMLKRVRDNLAVTEALPSEAINDTTG